ncbi:MAG: gdhA [Nitrososphaera sp.]|nr:gdhA [Nitrososphaera sp.]
MLETAKGSTQAINPFEVALKQLDEAVKLIKLDKGLQEVLANPKRVLTVSLPIRMDNGEIRVFTGFRSQHNDARGPYKGGIRCATLMLLQTLLVRTQTFQLQMFTLAARKWLG